jgi:hypothetical protein
VECAWTQRVGVAWGPCHAGLPPAFRTVFRPGLASDGSGFCVRYCTTVLQPPMQTLGFESSQSISRHPSNASGCAYVPRPLFEAAERNALHAARACSAPTLLGCVYSRLCQQRRLHQRQSGQYCELWLSLTGPRLWSTMTTLVSVSQASGRNRPTTVSITAQLALHRPPVTAEALLLTSMIRCREASLRFSMK